MPLNRSDRPIGNTGNNLIGNTAQTDQINTAQTDQINIVQTNQVNTMAVGSGESNGQSNGQGIEGTLSREFKRMIMKRGNYVRALKHHEPHVNAVNDASSKNSLLLRMSAIEGTYEKLRDINNSIENSRSITF